MQDNPRFAFISAGKLYLGSESKMPDMLVSEFAMDVTRWHEKSLQKHNWKNQSSGEGMMQYNLWNQGNHDPRDPVKIVSVVSTECGQYLYYILVTQSVGGLFCYDLKAKSERRIFHKEQFFASELSGGSGDNELLCAVQSGEATHIAMLSTERYQVNEITEGDSVDSSPSWDLRYPNAVVYQSAGIGRNNQGYFVGLGPSSIEWVNLDTGATETLLEDETCDYLKPTITEGGSVYCIRRPYERGNFVSYWSSIVEFIKIPYRLLKALFGFLSVLTQIFGKEKLIKTSTGEKQEVDAREVFIKGRMLEAQHAKNGDPDTFIPKNWELIKSCPDGGIKVIEQGVSDYCMNPNGEIIFSKGYSVWSRTDDKKSKLYRGKQIIDNVVGIA
jgi:hypothetical protein